LLSDTSSCRHPSLQEFHGKLEPANFISDVLARVQTGNIHAAVFDLTANYIYVSFMRPLNATVGPVNGYERQYTSFDAAALFAEKQ
jgi:hypothetical protein